jgi:pimeloyl-ACP methyl ester carboxylesterase
LSLGGIVGLYLAQRQPEVVESLLVSGVPFGRVSPALRALNRVLLAIYPRRWGAGLVARVFGIPDDESRQAFLETAKTTSPAALRDISDLNNNKPIPDHIGDIKAPTLAVVGEKDTKIARSAVPYLAEQIPDAIGATVPGVGHQWNAEEPDLFTEMVKAWVDDGEVHPSLIEQ